jgi:hypothetical protein
LEQDEMRKNGIVLMMTLVLISMILGVVALVLTQSQSINEKAHSVVDYSSTVRILEDLEKQLPQILSSITGAQELDMAMRLPFSVESRSGDFSLNATLSSPYTKININKLLDVNGSVNKPYVDVWMRLFSTHPIADSELLLKLVLDTIDSDRVQRDGDSEIALVRNDFANGQIASMEQFYQIIGHYKMRTRDGSVLKIPWERYIGFEGDKIDINAVNIETLALLLPEVSTDKLRIVTSYRTNAFTTKEEVLRELPELSALYDSFLFVYAPTLSYTVVCNLEITRNGLMQKSLFHYNLLDKKIHYVKM